MQKKNALITRFGIMRHASTEWNAKKLIQGQSDSPLTPEGISQANQWGEQLKAFKWDRIITSDLERASKTASIISSSLSVPIINEPGLREKDWGEWVGRTLSQVKKENAQILSEQESAGWDFTPPGGESRDLVLKRSRDALKTIAEKWPGETILIVCHQGIIKCLIYHLMKRRFLPTEPKLLMPYHLHLLAHDGERLCIEKLNAVELNL